MSKNTTFNYASVIVTYNRASLLIEAVNGLLYQTVAPRYIVIVNNMSTDNTVELLNTNFSNEIDSGRIIVENLSENLGGSFGFYKGLKIVTELNVDWISLSDDDVMFKSDFFELISNAAIEYPETKVFTGTVKLPDESIQLSHRRRVLSEITMKQTEISEGEYNSNFKLDTFTFVGVVIKKELVKKVGLPMKDYFIWYDDTEYALRVKKYTQIINVSNAVVIHKTKVVSKNGFEPNWREYYGIRNEIITNVKYSRLKIVNFIYIIIMYIKKNIGILVHRNISGYRLFQFKIRLHGTIDGLRGKSGENSKYYPGMKYKR